VPGPGHYDYVVEKTVTAEVKKLEKSKMGNEQ
jgi:hypothetical protein